MNDSRKPSNRHDLERAALAAVVKIGPVKKILVRIFEFFARPIVRLVDLWRAQRGKSDIPANVRTILVMEYWQLGDALILLPFLRNLRMHFPDARISMLASAPAKAVLYDQGVVDEWIPILVPWAGPHSRWQKYNPFSPLWLQLWRTLAALRRQPFDLAFSGAMDVRNNCLLWLTGARRRISYGFAGGAFFLTDSVAPNPLRPHRVENWLRLLEHLDKPVFLETVGLRLSSSQTSFADSFFSKLGVSDSAVVIGIHPGARIPLRRWGDDRFLVVAKALASEFKLTLLWFLGPGEDPPFPAPTVSFHFVQVSFSEFVAVLARCHLLICNDSGPMHLADSLGIPVVAIFGPQQPAWYGPRNKASHVVYRPEFWCRPCFDYCKFGQPYCLRTVTPSEVIQAASRAAQAIIDHRSQSQLVLVRASAQR